MYLASSNSKVYSLISCVQKSSSLLVLKSYSLASSVQQRYLNPQTIQFQFGYVVKQTTDFVKFKDEVQNNKIVR